MEVIELADEHVNDHVVAQLEVQRGRDGRKYMVEVIAIDTPGSPLGLRRRRRSEPPTEVTTDGHEERDILRDVRLVARARCARHIDIDLNIIGRTVVHHAPASTRGKGGKC